MSNYQARNPDHAKRRTHDHSRSLSNEEDDNRKERISSCIQTLSDLCSPDSILSSIVIPTSAEEISQLLEDPDFYHKIQKESQKELVNFQKSIEKCLNRIESKVADSFQGMMNAKKKSRKSLDDLKSHMKSNVTDIFS
ncbi:unnamed protein product [Moneuplotes crassus]|uniref:Uncharacterized protein n=1 Tax=Euplotes crassus TaxID=5936 RepID=A0AAD1Y339_EUPCR|nr:unnamed protein product [Moneuplotes crassus]